MVRDRAALARIVAGRQAGERLPPAGDERHRADRSATASPPTAWTGLAIASEPKSTVGPAESRWVPVRLQIPYGSAAAGSHPIHFDIEALGDAAQVREKSVFLVPR